jgi:hypothetical protein
MRLQLMRALVAAVVTLACALAVARGAAAQPVVQVDARGSIYNDSDDTTIGTATVAVRGTAADVLTIKARYLADVISSASVDVVSAATDRFDEIRHEAEGGVTYADGTNTLSGTYIYSYEPDWDSHTAALGLGRDFFQHQLTLGLGGNFVWNNVGRKDDDNFDEEMVVGGGTLSAAVVATKDDLISTAYSLIVSSGYQSSPYRYAYLADAATGLPFGPPESHPERRARHALALQYNRYLFKDSSLRSHVRGYLDDWGVKSVTVGTEYVIGFSPIELGARVRGYYQTKADFYEDIYPERRKYMTADRELSPFIDGFVGLRLGYRQRFESWLDTLKADAKFEVFGFRFFDFDRLPERGGLIGEVGLGAAF